jgi:peptide deformylase
LVQLPRMAASDENGRPVQAEVEDQAPENGEQPVLDPEIQARRERALALIRTFGDPALRASAVQVTRFDDSLQEEVARMAALMNDALGLGLAATQLGVMHRLFVFRVGADAPLVAVVNPQLEWSSSDQETAEEGCLSLPRVLVDVERPLHVRVRAQDERGEPILLEASGLEARVIQHEMDHLDGVLILDRTSKDQRKEAMRAMREGPADSDADPHEHRPSAAARGAG